MNFQEQPAIPSVTRKHNGMTFTTNDRNNGFFVRLGAQPFKGAWWYVDCRDSNLNGESR